MSREFGTEEGQISVFQLITLYSEYLNISRIRFSMVPNVDLKLTSPRSSIKSALLDNVVLEIQAPLA